jgi:hypothetical protein
LRPAGALPADRCVAAAGAACCAAAAAHPPSVPVPLAIFLLSLLFFPLQPLCQLPPVLCSAMPHPCLATQAVEGAAVPSLLARMKPPAPLADRRGHAAWAPSMCKPVPRTVLRLGGKEVRRQWGLGGSGSADVLFTKQAVEVAKCF